MAAQTFRDFEVVLHDDGSTDGTRDIIERFTARDRRFRCTGSQRLGLVGALNRCVEAADGPLLARMDADDLCHPERLRLQVEMLDQNPEIDVVSCRIRCFPDAAVEAGMRRYESWLNELMTPAHIARDLFVESPVCHPSVTLRRRPLEEVGAYLDDGTPEDYGLWLRLHEAGCAMAKVDKMLFEWRESRRRLTRTDPRYGRDRFTSLKVRHLVRGPLRECDTVTIWGAGKTGRSWADALGTAGMEVSRFLDVDPKKLGRRVRSSPVEPHTRAGTPGLEKIVVAVGAAGARCLIRDYLAQRGFKEPEHFVCVA